MSWPKTGATHYHALLLLGSQNLLKRTGQSVLVVCNSQDVNCFGPSIRFCSYVVFLAAPRAISSSIKSEFNLLIILNLQDWMSSCTAEEAVSFLCSLQQSGLYDQYNRQVFFLLRRRIYLIFWASDLVNIYLKIPKKPILSKFQVSCL